METVTRAETKNLLNKLSYKCQYCGRLIKPEKQASGRAVLDNVAVIEADGSVSKVCRKCAAYPLSRRRSELANGKSKLTNE
jgi:hypothetical protein